ncbi:MAG TPA: HAD family phosphatase [Candidatus Hydrogenedentes bacterium]|nr:HAD family phosphatase [Candidatus Hydrogenedentota bacterium]HPG67016.1 HAD family phosphatase [Candidatus Hydrogenedentota bacterium]
MIRAFLFDMDGTLLDTEILWVDAMDVFLAECGISMSREEIIELVYGIASIDIFEELGRRYPRLAAMSFEEMVERFHPHFVRLRESRDVRIMSSIELLKRLAADYPVAIVSGSSTRHVTHGIEMMGIESHLAFFLAGEHYRSGKPDPECYLAAAHRLEMSPFDCLVFEDSTAGVRAAKGAGMHCVALARPDRPTQDLTEADWVLADLGAFSVKAYLERCRA